MSTSNGSAASAMMALPQSAVRGVVFSCIKHLRHTADLAEIACSGADPVVGAEHIVGVVDDLKTELRQLRAYLASHG